MNPDVGGGSSSAVREGHASRLHTKYMPGEKKYRRKLGDSGRTVESFGPKRRTATGKHASAVTGKPKAKKGGASMGNMGRRVKKGSAERYV